MGIRGLKPKRKVKIEWSANFAYAIGLLATDGNVSSSGRHVSLVSKDIEQIENLQTCLGIRRKVGIVYSGYNGAPAFRIQIGSVELHRFLRSIGMHPAKSKTMESLAIPDDFFFDFLRGVIDGDGHSYSYMDPRWRSSFMFYVGISSAAPVFLSWIQETCRRLIGIQGHISKSVRSSCAQLRYAKAEAVILVGKLYVSEGAVCLSRKKLKIMAALCIMGRQDREKVSSC